MLRSEAQPKSLEPIDLPGFHFVRAADIVSKLEKKRGNAAHAAAGHADQMDPVPLTRQHLR